MEDRRITSLEIVKIWHDRCTAYDRDLRKYMLRVVVAAATFLVAVATFGQSPLRFVVLVLFAVLFSYFVLRIFLACTLMCPKCNDPPEPIGRYSHPRRAIVCEHCGSSLVLGATKSMGT